MRKFACHLGIAIIVTGCLCPKKSGLIDNTGMVTIKITDNREISTRDIIDKIEIVPLKTPDGVFVGNISDLYITGDRIIVTDTNMMDCVMLFDRSGEYVATIGRKGRAPNEYVDLTHVSIMPDGETIVLYDNYGRKLLLFDHDGRFIESKNVPIYFNSIEYLSNTDMVCSTYGLGEEDPGLEKSPFSVCSILFADYDLKIEGGLFPNRFRRDFQSKTPHLKKNKDIILINPSHCDTIYTVSSGKDIKAGYRVDMSEIDGFSNLDSDVTNEQLDEIRARRAMFDGDFLEADMFVKLNISCPPDSENPHGEIKPYVFNKTNGIAYLIRPDINDDDRYFANAHISIANTITEDDRIVAAVPAYIILMMAQKPILEKYEELKTLTDDSNPVLFFYSLKIPD